MLENEAFHDLTIDLDEGHGSVRANKAILCSNSTYFSNFFNNNIREMEVQNVDIKIPTTLVSMEIVIKFFYTGKMECDSLSLKDILDLLKLLELIEEKDLFSDVEEYLLGKLQERQFPAEKVLLLAKVCEDSKFRRISNKMLDYCNGSEGVEDLPEVMYLSSSFLEMLIGGKRWVINGDVSKGEGSEDKSRGDDNITKSDQHVEDDTEKSEEFKLLENFQFEMFKMFVNWLSGNQDCDTDFKAKILKPFDLRKFTSEELIKHVRQSSLYSDKDIIDAFSQKNHRLCEELSELKECIEVQKKEFEKEKKELKKNFEQERKDLVNRLRKGFMILLTITFYNRDIMQNIFSIPQFISGIHLTSLT